MMQKLLVSILVYWMCLPVYGQYISRSEPIPYNCPVVCASGTLTLKIPQIQNLPAGSQIQALLSNSSGSFASGTQVLPVASYSTNTGTSWTNGIYTYSANINDLYIQVIIPIGTPVGSNYTIKIQASTGYVSADLFQCSSSNTITVTPYVTPLNLVNQSDQGIGNWIGHVYTWTPTTGVILNTPALVSAQTFFASLNYQGHVLYSPLPLNLTFSSTGGVPGTLNNGTSIDCGNSFTTNYSMRLKRQENFSPGYYQFTIQGDDGIRFSLDGGATWILDAFLEQTFASSFRTTNTNYPNGICLSGPTDLVIEYFQRPADAQLTFTSTLLSAINFTQPTAQSICENGNASFSLGSPNASLNYQWQVSTDGGTTFSNLVNGGVYSGVNTSTLTLTNVPISMSGYYYQCVVTTTCQGNIVSGQASLSVSSSPTINTQPTDQSWCTGQNIVFTAGTTGSGAIHQWQVSTDGGATFSNISNNAVYSGATTSILTITGATAAYVGYQYQLVINGCSTVITSNSAEILSGGSITINQQPQPMTVCQGDPATMSVIVSGGSSYQWQVDGGSGFNNVNDNNGYSGSQTATLSLIGAATSVNGLVYQCIISSGCSGSVTSASAVLTVNPNTGITQQAQNQTICSGQNATFTITAGGSGLSYQWQISTDGGTTFANISNTAPFAGVTTPSLSLTAPADTYTGAVFHCVVNGTCGSSQTSNNRTLTITSLPVIQIQPTNQNGCEGNSVTFTGSFSGNPNLTWQMSTDNGLSFVNVVDGGNYSGSTTENLTISSISISLNQVIFQLSANGCGTTVLSSTALLEVFPLPTVQLTSAPPPVCPGENVSISVSSTNAVSLQWQMNTNGTWTNVVDGSTYAGTTTETLNINNIPASLQQALFRCMVIGACLPDVYSEEVLLYLNGIPVITSQPTSQVACSGGTVSFPLGVQGDGISFEWQLKQEDGTYSALTNNELYSGVNSSNLVVAGANEVDGITIRCQLSGCGDELLTDTFHVTIYQNDPVYIPNAFSPDGDPNNQRFMVYTEGEPRLDASIFDRWGELVYHWTSIEDGWDGTYLGKEAQEGVYVYRIVINTSCERRTQQGSITVFR